MNKLIGITITIILLYVICHYVFNVPSLYRKYKHNRNSGFAFIDSIIIAWRWIH